MNSNSWWTGTGLFLSISEVPLLLNMMITMIFSFVIVSEILLGESKPHVFHMLPFICHVFSSICKHCVNICLESLDHSVRLKEQLDHSVL